MHDSVLESRGRQRDPLALAVERDVIALGQFGTQLLAAMMMGFGLLNGTQVIAALVTEGPLEQRITTAAPAIALVIAASGEYAATCVAFVFTFAAEHESLRNVVDAVSRLLILAFDSMPPDL